MAENTIYDVIIVGYGAAGVIAHRDMHAAGLKVLILEAADRIGGRIHTVPFTDAVVDLGAEYVDGSEGNVVYDIAVGLDQFASRPKLKYLFTDGEVLNDGISRKLEHLYRDILKELKAKEWIDGNVSIGEYFVAEYEKRVQADEYSDISDYTKGEFLKYIHQAENAREASDSWFKPSAESYINGWEVCPGIQSITWRFGFKALIDRLLLEILENSFKNPELLPSAVLYEKEVQLIEYGGADGTKDHPVTVTCKDESVYKGKIVLVTVSLGVLKEIHERLFKPILPKSNHRAIVSLGFGNTAKIIVHWAKEWWRGKPFIDGAHVLWTEDDANKLPEEESWMLGARTIYRPENHRYVFTIWITGKASKTVELLPIPILKQHVVKLFKMLNKGEEVPEPCKLIRTQWNNDRFFRGTYSHRTVYSESMSSTPDNLASPVTNNSVPVICFAGEATSSHHYGTAHGAVETGMREAKRIVGQLQSGSEKVQQL